MFGSLAFAFLFFITVRGDLSKFLGVFGLSASAGGSSASGLSNPLSLGNITGSGQGTSYTPNIGGSGFGQLGNITGGSIGGATLPNPVSGAGDTGWYDASTGSGGASTSPSGWTDTTGGDTGWVQTS